MERWKLDYITCRLAGRDAVTCAARCAGMPLAMVMDHMERDEEFKDAWYSVAPPGERGEALLSIRELTPAALESMLTGQVTDEEAAAYFGMTVDDMMQAIEGDERLARVYKFARTGGKAAIKVAQYEKAVAGDASMLTWVGKQVLGQTDKVDVARLGQGNDGSPVTINQVILQSLPQDVLEGLLDKARGIGTDLVIDGQAVRVEDNKDG